MGGGIAASKSTWAPCPYRASQNCMYRRWDAWVSRGPADVRTCLFFFRENNAGIVAERGDLVWLDRTLAVRAEREIDVRQANAGKARGRDARDGIPRFRRDLGGLDGIGVPRWFWVGQFWAIKSRSMCEVGVERGCACCFGDTGTGIRRGKRGP